MKEHENRAYRARPFTYYEMITFAQFYHAHHGERSIDNLMISFFRWKEISKEYSITTRRLLLIEDVVIKYYGLALAEVRGKRRYQELVRARQVIAYLAVQYAPQNIVSKVLGMPRNSIQSGKTKCGEMIKLEKLLSDEVAKIRKRLVNPLQALDDELRQLEEKAIKVNDAADEVS